MPRSSRLALALSLTVSIAAHAQPAHLVGYWQGTMISQGARLPISLEFTLQRDTLHATWSAPELRALGVPLQRVALTRPTVTFALVGDQSTTNFEGTLRGDSVMGNFTGGEGTGTFVVIRRPKPTLGYRELEVTFKNDTVTLAGSLLVPNAPGRHPALVFAHGSGPEGRAGGRYLAAYAATHGIVALIYDKRGVGTSTGDWRYATIPDLAADALAGIALLKRRGEVAPGQIGIYGHSQGGLVVAAAASKSKDLRFAIAAASYGGIGYEQDLYRVENALAASNFKAEERTEAFTWYRRFVEVIRTREGVEAFERDLTAVASKPWIQWLSIPPRDHWLWKTYPAIGNFNPAPLWEHVTIPVLLLYGEEDKVVPPAASIEQIGRALNRAGNTSWGAVLLPRASHPFMVNRKPGEPFRWPVVAPGLGTWW